MSFFVALCCSCLTPMPPKKNRPFEVWLMSSCWKVCFLQTLDFRNLHRDRAVLFSECDKSRTFHGEVVVRSWKWEINVVRSWKCVDSLCVTTFSNQTALLKTPQVEGIGAMLQLLQRVIICCQSPHRSCGIRTTTVNHCAAVSPDDSKLYRCTCEG